MPNPIVRVEFCILWDDHTWEKGHYHNIPMPDSGEEFESGGSMVLEAATRFANQELLPIFKTGAVMMIAVNDEPAQNQENSHA